MIFAANFKTNRTRQSTAEYVELLAQLVTLEPSDRIMIFPPLTALDHFGTPFTIGAQNAYPIQSGAVTGEVGLEQLEEFEIQTILIGHSERRTFLGEDQASVAKKFEFFKQHGFEIVYCIGEPLEVREQGMDAVMEYLLAQCEGIDRSYAQLVVAYEPIWAIGTGVSASSDQIAQTHQALKKHIDKPLLYGGSVKPDNVKEIVAIGGVDGVLVGSASLDPTAFAKIVSSR